MRVLISGAGVAGPTLAWFLAKSGASVMILEKSENILPHGQNVDLQGSAITVVKKMGLLEQVRQHNTNETGTQIVNAKGQPLASFPIKEGCAASMTSEFEILRGDLAAILYKSTKDLPGVKYLFGTTITNVTSNDVNTVKVETSDGETREFDLLVAADGQWSKVRKQCFAPESVEAKHFGMYAVYFTIPKEPSDNDMWNIYIALKSRLVAMRPDPHGTMRAMMTVMPRNKAQGEAWRKAGRMDRKNQEELVRREFADAGWQSKRLLNAMPQAPDFYFHVIEQIKMSRWSNSRVVCLGDTAYAPTPLTGMGTSLAILGAYMLAGELSKLKNGENPGKALADYESKFRPFVEQSQSVPFFFPSMAHPETAWKRWLVNTVMRAIANIVAIPWVPKLLGDPSNEDFALPNSERNEKEGRCGGSLKWTTGTDQVFLKN